MNPDPSYIFAYETQARYTPGDAWITIAVSATRQAAARRTLGHRDVWGRAPVDVRLVAIGASAARAA
jgi:hypothetical protein